MLIVFVSHCKKIYHIDFLVYNIHALIHLADDAKLYGSLNNISAFPFENYFGQLKKLVRGPKLPLEQLYCRLTELNNKNMTTKNLPEIQMNSEHFNGPVTPDHPNCKQFEQVIFKKFKFTTYRKSEQNSYFLSKDNAVVQINKILVNTEGEFFIIGKAFISYSSLYTYPIDQNFCKFLYFPHFLKIKYGS